MRSTHRPASKKSAPPAATAGAPVNTADPVFAPPDFPAPNAFLMMLEGRAPWEYAALLAATPWLRKLPRGDGHPVIVFPGLGANDATTQPLRRFLDGLGYETHPWHQGFNFGPRQGVLEQCSADVKALFKRHARQVSLVGWSLGGIYARELAKELPDHTRCVVTLGTPFTGHPRATNAWRFFELMNGRHVGDPVMLEQIRRTPPVPTTSIYSRTDGIVSWRCSVIEPDPALGHSENIEVHASHLGLGLNPLALFALADRLTQDPQHWAAFDPQGAKRWFFRTPI